MAGQDEAGSPWYFRQRQWLFGAIYGIGFFFGFLSAGFRGDVRATYHVLGDLVPALGSQGWLGIAVAVTFVGWVWRVWGSSYLSGEIVWSMDARAGSLNRAGPYRLTRNPLYFGNLLIALGIGAIGPPEATAIIVLGNFALDVLLIRHEEPALAAAFGVAYDDYRRAVPALFPRLWPARDAAPEEPPARASLREGLRSEVMTGGFFVAMVVGFLTQHPLSLYTGAIYIGGVVLNEWLQRPEVSPS